LELALFVSKKQLKKYTRKPTGRTSNNGAQYLEELDRICSSRS
jgi:hypothetical protein